MVAPRWDEDDLVRRLCAVLDTAERTLAMLVPDGYQDEVDPDVGVTAEKVISETALLLLAAADASHHGPVRTRIERITARLIPCARSTEVRMRLCFQPWLAHDHASAHACLSRLGYPDEDLDRLYALSLVAESAGGYERVPYRDLEQEWLGRVWTPASHVPKPEDPSVAQRSMLGQQLNALTASREDLYAFSHAVIYLTDLGARLPRLPRSATAILADADAALAHCLDQQDYDVAAEILLAWPYLRRRWSASATFGFQVLAWVEDQAGFLPSPFTRVERYRALSGEARSRYALATAYHTAYVMGLLCCAALRPDRAPPTTIPAGRGYRDVAGPLLDLLDAAGAKGHWRTCISTLPARSRDALSPLLLTMVLQRAAARYDLAAIHTALRLALRFGLHESPAARQAAQMLERAGVLHLPTQSTTLPLASADGL